MLWNGVEGLFGRQGVGDHLLEPGAVVRGPVVTFIFVLPNQAEALFIRGRADPFELCHEGLLIVRGNLGVGCCCVLAHFWLLEQVCPGVEQV